MPLSLEMLLYCSTISRERYKLHLELSKLPIGVGDMTFIRAGIRQAVTDRLRFAEHLLEFAEGLCSVDGTAMSEISARNVLSRAYYVVHHTIRALLLYEEHGDIDGHQESITAVCKRVGDVAALHTFLGNNAAALRTELLDLLHQRHLADYYPYGASQIGEAVLNFPVQAESAIQLARRLLEGTSKYISLKEAGTI